MFIMNNALIKCRKISFLFGKYIIVLDFFFVCNVAKKLYLNKNINWGIKLVNTINKNKCIVGKYHDDKHQYHLVVFQKCIYFC